MSTTLQTVDSIADDQFHLVGARQQSHVTKHNEMQNFCEPLGTKNELRKFEEILALELNKYMYEFIISLRTVYDKDYEPSSLRSLLNDI